MKLVVTARNYRCFSHNPGASIRVGEGVSALVGENNSGKTALLRLFHDFRPVFEALRDAQTLAAAFSKPGLSVSLSGIQDPEEVFSIGNPGPLQLDITLQTPRKPAEPNSPPELRSLRLELNRQTWVTRLHMPEVKDTGNLAAPFTLANTVLYRGGFSTDMEMMREAIALLASTLYIPTNRLASGSGGWAVFDVEVGNAFVSQWHGWQHGSNKRHNHQIDLIEETIAELMGLPGLKISANSAKTTMHFKFHGGTFRADEIGSGIVNILVPIATAAMRGTRILLIDEPELGLHPSLQLKFLAALGRFAPDGIVFTTHNLGLARNAADRVYSVVRRQAQTALRGAISEVHPYQKTPYLPELLGSLSYTSYGASGATHVLLVEGPTDTRMLQPLLALLGVDDRVVIMHMGGSSTITMDRAAGEQLAGVQRICPNVWCLIDSEFRDPTSVLETHRAGFLEICSRQAIKCHVTERRATENYMTASACLTAFGASARPLQPYEEIRTANPGWSKEGAWRAAREMTLGDWEGTDVLTFAKALADDARQNIAAQA